MGKSRFIPEELIKIKAQEFWKKRQVTGQAGTPQDSRREARHYLAKHPREVWQWRLTKTLSKRPIKRFADWWETTPAEKFVLEDIKYLLENSALLSIITLIAEVTIILSLITWIAGKQKRWEDEIFATWQVVNEAEQDQSRVVKLALERLLRNDFSLQGLQLENTNLSHANLQKAVLSGVNLQKAVLSGINLQEAALWDANLQKTLLKNANLQKSTLIGANLQEADLREANLQQAYLRYVNLQKADLKEANLQQAILQEADLWDANLQQAVLSNTKHLTSIQIKQACFWEQAIYKSEWNYEKKTHVIIEPDNTNFIEKLKQNKSSDPAEKPDCIRWKR